MRYVTKTLSILLIVAMLAGFFLIPGAPKAAAATACYGDYSLLDVIENYGGCTGAQGMALDDTYIYNVKIASSTQDNAFITRTHRTTGATTYLTNASTGGVYFTNLYHANDLEMVTINGVQNLLVATGQAGSNSLVRFTLSGTKLTQAGTYTAMLNGSQSSVSSAQVMRVNGTVLDLIIKKNKYLYYGTLDTAKTSGQFTITSAFTLDVANVSINGKVHDLTDWLHQGFEYIDHKIFVPITGATDMSISSIVVYDTQGASGTIRNDPSLSFYIDSSVYANKFEIESCGICPSDGKLYFNTNQAKTGSDANHDAINVINDYVYDPSGGASESGVYRWETKNGSLQSVTTGGAAYNGVAMSQGSISDTDFTAGRFSLHEGVVLKHDEPWILEWKGAGNWTNGSLLMSSHNKSKYEGNRYIFRRQNSTLIALGEFSGNTYYNYGLDISSYGIDGNANHVYRMTNKINADGSNMVYLSVDGRELGPMNNYYLAGSAQGTTSNWISGKDFTFSYFGTDLHPVNDCSLEYIQIWGKGLLDQRDEPDTYRWESGMKAVSATNLTANTATALGGSVSGSTHTDSRYALDRDVVLLHDRPWSVEWKSEGAWTGGALLLAASAQSKTVDAPFLFRNKESTVIALGYHDGTQFNNYGVGLEAKGIDGTVSHTYRLTNRINADGSNMVYLYVDGVELGSMTEYFVGGTAQGTTDHWVAGKDFTFSYIGTVQHDINATVNYLQIWENGIPADHTPNRYRWETVNDTLTSITDGFVGNTFNQLAGSIKGGVYSSSYFRLDKPVVLLHNRPWSVQWQSEGSFKDAASGTLLLAAASYGNQINATYLYRRNDSQIIAFGERYDGYHQNYGIKLSDHGIDGTAPHTYRLENRINADGSNMVYLFVDGVELGAMNHYYKGGTAQNTTSNWISGKDFVFSYMGNPDFPVGNCSIGYLQVEEGCSHSYGSWTVTQAATCTVNGSRTRSCTLCGEIQTESIAATGHSYSVEVKAPTCVNMGYTIHTCLGCGYSYRDHVILATGHSYKTTTIAPNCNNPGYTSYTCTACGDSYTGDTIPAIGHSYSTVTVDATCIKDGSSTKTCILCGDRQVQVIPATGHSYKSTVIDPTCTTGGYTTYACNRCDHSYQDQITNPTGHSYANGSCGSCGAADPNYTPAITKPTLTLKSPALEFKDMIKVVAFYTAENLQDVTEMGMITYSSNVGTPNIATAENVIPGATYDAASGYYYSASQGIHAKYLADTVYLAIYAKLTDGSFIYTKLVFYSPVTYAMNQLNYSSDTNLKQLVAAMLIYGAEAQLYFGHNTGSLANASLTADQKALPESYRSDMVSAVPTAPADKQGVFANNQGFASRRPAISFEGAFCINYFFTPKYAPTGGITLYYWTAEDYDANSVLAPSNATGYFAMTGSGTGQYRGDLTGIAAKALSEAVYVAAVYSDSDGTVWTSGVLGYSIGAYCGSLASQGTTVADLAKATAVYGYHAKQYFG